MYAIDYMKCKVSRNGVNRLLRSSNDNKKWAEKLFNTYVFFSMRRDIIKAKRTKHVSFMNYRTVPIFCSSVLLL